ncbi:MAG: DNA polymerase III subunit alpha [Phycisphaerae bacterium]
MAGQGFTHLHLHTEYSLLDGAVRTKQLLEKCKQYHMDAVAVTDHGNMYAAIEFYKTFTGSGVKPIMGFEAYYTPHGRANRSGKSQAGNYHLILLAENNIGYRNLIKLTSRAYTEGFYYHPRVDDELLEEYSEGIIATSACIGGIIPKYIMNGREEDARIAAENYLRIFGENNFFMEIQRHDYVDSEPVDPNPAMIDLANRLGIGIVATNDVHFLNKDDYQAHDILTCISTGKIYGEQNRMHYPTSVYFKDAAEMRELFSDIPQACDLTNEIAARCNVEIDLKTRHAPTFKPPAGKTPGGYLRELVYAGAEKLYGEITDDVRERIEREIGVIDGKGFSSYFLIVWEFCDWASKNGIPTGARGSGVGTIVGYCLGLCNVDPIKYGLLFERFMDPERNEMPDIDIDICQDGRGRLLNYVREKYGEIAQITTFGTLKAKMAVRDVGRALNVPLSDVNRIAKLIPEGPKVTLDKALAGSEELRAEYDADEQVRQMIDIGRKLEGLCRHAGVHACAVVIADEPLNTLLPVYRQSQSEDLITQFEGAHVEAVGLLKMDFLGLKTLSVIESTKRMVKEIHGVDIDIENIDITDQSVFEQVFTSGHTKGVFQFESDGMVKMLREMKPDRIEDLIAANALYRPGPMSLIPDFIARKHGAEWDVPHPIMREILEETFGIMIYQEQVMQICHRLGDIKLREAYKLIKAISKKKKTIIDAAKEQFVQGCVGKGLDAATGNAIFELIEKFAEYGFNKSHSSRYSFVAFQTAYLKRYWPCEFMASILTYEHGDQTKVKAYIQECRDIGIDILPPDINESGVYFTAVYSNEEARKNRTGRIRFGLGAVKGVGDKAVEQIVEARKEHGQFKDLFDFCDNVDLRLANKQVLEALIKSGAFDRLGGSRAQLFAGVEMAMKAGQSAQADRQNGQGSLFGGFELAVHDSTPHLPDVPAWPEMTMLNYEKDVLGMFVTSNPLSKYADTITAYSTAHSDEIEKLAPDTELVIGGMISELRVRPVQSGRNAGRKMATFKLEDFNGRSNVVVFSDQLANCETLLEDDALVFVMGKLDKRREEPQIVCDRIVLPEAAPEVLNTNVWIRWNTSRYGKAELASLLGVIGEHSGSCPVFVEIVSSAGSVSVRADRHFSVSPDSKFRDEVRSMLGKDSLELRRGRN